MEGHLHGLRGLRFWNHYTPASAVPILAFLLLIIALTTVCLAASATINRYPVLRRLRALIQEGEKSLAHGDRAQALSDFREAERLEPADYCPHAQLNSIYSALGDSRRAREESEWAVRLRPDLRRISAKPNRLRTNAEN